MTHIQDRRVITPTDILEFQARLANSLNLMKLTVRRYGGYAGINEVLVTLDSKSLRAEADAALRSVLERMRQLLPVDQAPGADFIHYEILIEEPNARTETILFVDDGSDGARKLVELTNEIVAIGKKNN